MSTHPQANPAVEPIPQFDLSAQYAAIGAEIRTAIERVLSSQQFVLGPEHKLLRRQHAFDRRANLSANRSVLRRKIELRNRFDRWIGLWMRTHVPWAAL